MASLLLLHFFETMFAELSLRVNVVEKSPLPGRRKQHCWITSCAAAALKVGRYASEMAYRLLPHSLFVCALALWLVYFLQTLQRFFFQFSPSDSQHLETFLFPLETSQKGCNHQSGSAWPLKWTPSSAFDPCSYFHHPALCPKYCRTSSLSASTSVLFCFKHSSVLSVQQAVNAETNYSASFRKRK